MHCSKTALNDASKLIADQLGVGLYDKDFFAYMNKNPNIKMFYDYDGEKMKGVAIATIIRSKEDFPSYFKSHLRTDFPVGHLNVSVVDIDYRQKGLGAKLLQQRIKWLKNGGCHEVFSITEIYPNLSNGFHVLRKAGLKPRAVKTHPWKPWCDKYKNCPALQHNRECRCTGLLFSKKLDQDA